MKTCAICARQSADAAPWCVACGEATWLAPFMLADVLAASNQLAENSVPVREAPPSVAEVPSDDDSEDAEDEASGAQSSLPGAEPALSRKERKRRERGAKHTP